MSCACACACEAVSCVAQAHCERDRRHVWRICLVLELNLLCYIVNVQLNVVLRFILSYILNYQLKCYCIVLRVKLHFVWRLCLGDICMCGESVKLHSKLSVIVLCYVINFICYYCFCYCY